MELITIVPEPGNEKFVGQTLLALADDHNDVVYVSRPQPGFQISEELFARFMAYEESFATEVEKLDEDPVIVEIEEVEQTPAPRRGRPKKNVEAQ